MAVDFGTVDEENGEAEGAEEAGIGTITIDEGSEDHGTVIMDQIEVIDIVVTEFCNFIYIYLFGS